MGKGRRRTSPQVLSEIWEKMVHRRGRRGRRENPDDIQAPMNTFEEPIKITGPDAG
jgi:hypothetical protein